MTAFAKYYEILRITVRSRLVYLKDVLASTLFLVVILFVFVKLWQATLAGGQTVEGFDLTKMIWYYVATETIIMSMLPLHRTFEREIREGDITVRMNKPYSYLLFHFSAFLGEAMVKAVLLLAVGSLVTSLMVGGLPTFQWQSLPALAVLYVTTIALNFCYNALIGLSAFWTEDVTGLFFVMDRAKWLLGGFLLPISIFPEPLKSVAQVLPFQLMIYAPARVAVDFSWTLWARTLGLQLMLLAVLGALAQLVVLRGFKRLNVNGG